MDKLKNKKYHEAIGIINPKLSKSFKTAYNYTDMIPYNHFDNVNKDKINKDKLSQEELQELFFKTNLNIGNTNEKFIESYLIKVKDYKTLMELYKTKYPFSLLPEFHLYAYCRKLCKKGLKKKDYDKIYSDLYFIENTTQSIEDKQFKKENVNTIIKF